MALKKSGKSFLFLGLFALGIFLTHLLINSFTHHLQIFKELLPIHLIVFSLCTAVYSIINLLTGNNSKGSLLTVLGGISAKMTLTLILILVFYFLKQENTTPFIFSFFVVYIVYLPVISYIFIKDFN